MPGTHVAEGAVGRSHPPYAPCSACDRVGDAPDGVGRRQLDHDAQGSISHAAPSAPPSAIAAISGWTNRVIGCVRKRQRRRRNRVVARLPPLRPERKRPGRGGRSRPMVLLPRGCACGVPWGGPSRVADPPSTVADGQGRRSTTAPIAATSPRSSGGRLLLANISRAFALPCSTPAKSM
jgi:hypothetical protein